MPTTVRRTSILSLLVTVLFAVITVAPPQVEEKKVTTTTVTAGEMCVGCVKQTKPSGLGQLDFRTEPQGR